MFPTKLMLMLMPSPVLFGALVVTASNESIVIIGDNPALRAWCIIGAMLGGFLSIALFPLDDTNMPVMVRRLMVKWIASTVIGYLVTPIFVRHFGVSPVSDNLLAISATFGFFGITVLHIVSPRVVKWFKRKLDGWLGDE